MLSISRIFLSVLIIAIFTKSPDASAITLKVKSAKKVSENKKNVAKKKAAKKRKANSRKTRATKKLFSFDTFDEDFYHDYSQNSHLDQTSSAPTRDAGRPRQNAPIRCQEQFGLTNENNVGSISYYFNYGETYDLHSSAESACNNGGYKPAGDCPEGCTAVINSFETSMSPNVAVDPINRVATVSVSCITHYSCRAF